MLQKNKKILINYIYNLIYQIFIIIVPIIVTPYISRILTDVGSGQYSFTYSISNYFTLFATLGFIYYGQRQIAKHQGNKLKQSIDFWGIIITRFISVFLTLLVYFILIYFDVYGDKYNYLMEILSLNVLAVGFDISFFFYGNEDFKKTVIRNVIIRTLGIIAVFVFVKDISDLWIYVLIQALSTLLSNLSLWFYLPKYLVKIKLADINIMKHLKPALILFLPAIATTIYTSLDKTLIGIITKSDSENGNYDYADKLIKVLTTVVISLGTVLVPRNARLFEIGDIEGVKKNIYFSCRFVFLLGIPSMLGMIAIANNFAPWFLGPGYDKVPILLQILSPLVILLGMSNIFGMQFMIPNGQDTKFTICVAIGAGTNFFLNLIMIYFWQAIGAAIATIIAETCVTCSMLIFLRKYIRITKIFKSCYKYIIAGILMFIPCYILSLFLTSSIVNTFIIIGIGIIIYLFALILLRDNLFILLLRKILMKKKR